MDARSCLGWREEGVCTGTHLYMCVVLAYLLRVLFFQLKLDPTMTRAQRRCRRCLRLSSRGYSAEFHRFKKEEVEVATGRTKPEATNRTKGGCGGFSPHRKGGCGGFSPHRSKSAPTRQRSSTGQLTCKTYEPHKAPEGIGMNCVRTRATSLSLLNKCVWGTSPASGGTPPSYEPHQKAPVLPMVV